MRCVLVEPSGLQRREYGVLHRRSGWRPPNCKSRVLVIVRRSSVPILWGKQDPRGNRQHLASFTTARNSRSCGSLAPPLSITTFGSKGKEGSRSRMKESRRRQRRRSLPDVVCQQRQGGLVEVVALAAGRRGSCPCGLLYVCTKYVSVSLVFPGSKMDKLCLYSTQVQGACLYTRGV